MDQIKIANLLLTRKCNLACEYCRISADINYSHKPNIYNNKDYYYKNEKDTNFWIQTIEDLQKHNKDIFLILYGGEPFLRKDLYEIVNFCNSIEVAYTIISSCNTGIQKSMNEFFDKIGKVKGFTASVDPGFYNDTREYIDIEEDSVAKSHMGFTTLKRLISEGRVEDPVAEITVSPYNIQYLKETIKRLDAEGITSDITVVDVSKNQYYDFSSITDTKLLVQPSMEIKELFRELADSNYKIHMKDNLVQMIYDILPAKLDCEFDKHLTNISIDSDGMIRTCLRIRGLNTRHKANDLFDENYEVKDIIKATIKNSKDHCCKGCAWTCALMSKLESHGILTHY